MITYMIIWCVYSYVAHFLFSEELFEYFKHSI